MKQHLQSKLGFIACQMSGKRSQSKSIVYGVDRRTFELLDDCDKCEHCKRFVAKFRKPANT